MISKTKSALFLIPLLLLTYTANHYSDKPQVSDSKSNAQFIENNISGSLILEKHLASFEATMSMIEQRRVMMRSKQPIDFTSSNDEIEEDIATVIKAEIKPVSKSVASNDFDYIHYIFPLVEYAEIDNQLPKLQQDLSQIKTTKAVKTQLTKKPLKTEHIGYWQTVYSIESKQGKLLFRPRNKSRNCNHTSGPCGHHQLTTQALKDIGCNSLQCRKDRLNYQKSLKLSKKLLALNEKRLRKNGISKLEGYQKYLIHQQGAYGIKNIIAATQGKKTLSKKIKRNMANNSPYSYRQLRKMGSKAAARKFMKHWENKWLDEKLLIVALQTKKPTNSLTNPDFIPTFDESEITLALNYRF